MSEINKNEAKLNETMEAKNLENAAGGDFIDDVKDVLKKLITNPFEGPKLVIPPVIAHTK